MRWIKARWGLYVYVNVYVCVYVYLVGTYYRWFVRLASLLALLVSLASLAYHKQENKGGREAKGRRKGRGGEEEGGEIERERKRERERGTREIEIQGEVAIPDGGSQRMIK